jgi:hypothetical protein
MIAFQANNTSLLIASSLTQAITFSTILQFKDPEKEDIVAIWKRKEKN